MQGLVFCRVLGRYHATQVTVNRGHFLLEFGQALATGSHITRPRGLLKFGTEVTERKRTDRPGRGFQLMRDAANLLRILCRAGRHEPCEDIRGARLKVLQHLLDDIPAVADQCLQGADIVQAAAGFTRRIDRLPLPCRSAPGFVVNRILMPYINEALFALEAGLDAVTIDQAGRNFGMPMGPIELADVVGLDVCLHVGAVLAAAFGRSTPQVLESKIADGHLGRKSGRGFYTWRDGKAERPAGPTVAVPADMEDRLMLPMLNEAVACLRERVIGDADLLDAGAIFATGFAPFRGGPLQYARDRGVAVVVARLTELSAVYGERFRPDAGWDLLREPA